MLSDKAGAMVSFTISLIHHLATPNRFCRPFRCPLRARRSSATGLGAASEAAAIQVRHKPLQRNWI